MRVLFGFALLACSAAHAADMADIRYLDTEENGSSYPTRILVSERYLRMDEGRDDGDFTLLDRKTRKLVNVDHDRHMIIEMHDRPLPKSPPHEYRVEKKIVPVREGTVRMQVLVNGKLCSETVAAGKLFPDVAHALSEYMVALSYTQWATYRATPEELRQDCDLAHHMWQAGLALSNGLPMEQRDYTGRVRSYQSGSRLPLKPELFRLPKGFEVFQLPDPEGDGTGNSSQPLSEQTR